MTHEGTYRGIRKKIKNIFLPAVLLFAFCFCIKAGGRGFFAFDQSIVFDGGYRIYSGQTPYADFYIPFGPVVFWLQALFFGFFGVNYYAYLIHAATINALAALCVFLAIRTWFPEHKFLPYPASFLTAVWFYPPIGTPWADQTAFFFDLAALTILLGLPANNKTGKSERPLAVIAAGGFASLAVLSKQNIGLFFLPLCLLYLIIKPGTGRKRCLQDIMAFSAGCGAVLILFLVWLFIFSDAKAFAIYTLQIPAEVGSNRLFSENTPLLKTFDIFSSLSGLPFVRFINIITLLTAPAVALQVIRKKRNGQAPPQKLLMSALIGLYLILLQNLIIHTSWNQQESYIPFTGLILAAAAGIWLNTIDHPEFKTRLRLWGKRFAWTILLVAGLGASLSGIKAALDRRVQEFFSLTQFSEEMNHAKLKGLRWGHSSRRGLQVSGIEFLSLLNFLEMENRPFFVFPDYTVLYGLTGQPASQPVLWFHKGLTYPEVYDKKLDRLIVERLKANNVEIIVIENRSWFYTEKRLNDFPQLKNFIHSQFTPFDQLGHFRVFLKKTLSLEKGPN